MDQSSCMCYRCVCLLDKYYMSKSSYTYICSEDTHPRPAIAPIMMRTLYLIIRSRLIGFVGVKVLTQRVSSVVPGLHTPSAYTL